MSKQLPLSFLCLAVFLRRHPHQLAEHTREVVGIFYTYLITDLVDLHIRVVQQEAGLLNFQQVEVGQGRMPRLSLEKQGEVRRRIVHVRSHVLQSEVLLQIFLHVMYGDGHHVDVIHGTRVGLAELLEVAQGTEVIVEEGGYIVQVLLAVSRLQGIEHLLEKGVAVIDAPARNQGEITGRVGERVGEVSLFSATRYYLQIKEVPPFYIRNCFELIQEKCYRSP